MHTLRRWIHTDTGAPNLIDIEMPPHYKNYFAELENKLLKLYEIAEKARKMGLDASLEVDAKITTDIAERIEKLIGPPGITERMRELENMNRREMGFKIAQEIALGRFGVMEKEKAADQAIRTALAIITEGVTVAPIEGIPEIKIKQNPDRTQFLSVYLAGPIRPAGGTAQALTLVIADVVRRGAAEIQSNGYGLAERDLGPTARPERVVRQVILGVRLFT